MCRCGPGWSCRVFSQWSLQDMAPDSDGIAGRHSHAVWRYLQDRGYTPSWLMGSSGETHRCLLGTCRRPAGCPIQGQCADSGGVRGWAGQLGHLWSKPGLRSEPAQSIRAEKRRRCGSYREISTERFSMLWGKTEVSSSLHITAAVTDFCFLTSTYQNSLCQHGKHLLSEASSSFRPTLSFIFEPYFLIACQPIIDKCHNKQPKIMGTLEKGFHPPVLW